MAAPAPAVAVVKQELPEPELDDFIVAGQASGPGTDGAASASTYDDKLSVSAKRRHGLLSIYKALQGARIKNDLYQARRVLENARGTSEGVQLGRAYEAGGEGQPDFSG